MMTPAGNISKGCIGLTARFVPSAALSVRRWLAVGSTTTSAKACNAKFTAAFGTPPEGTHLPMRTWFTALYLPAVSSKGLSSVALGRHLSICQKTAWFLGHRIRAMMEDNSGLLKGIVEADETYVGGVNHSAGVRSDPLAAAKAHSNTAESWNATFKRAISGVWHRISIKHLDRYCTETAFRWNHRRHDGRLAALHGGNTGRLPWKELVA
jgi:hypothetical protein